MSALPVVAIDGPAGSGKSIVARAVAAALGLPALETGAMYRALTWAVLSERLDPADGEGVAAVARRARIEVGAAVVVDGQEVTIAIRSPEVTAAVSAVSAHAAAREAMVAGQREWIATHGGGVVEGRDIGTVVAPDAVLKIFLTASEEARARRRHAQVTQEPAGPPTLDATLSEMRQRDRIDSTRAASPLAPAADAVVLDTTELSVGEVVTEILRRYRQALRGTPGPFTSGSV